ncbi:hypothetical protein [Alkalihalobacterium chitinilyticum]|uniref:DUF4145 domain-containing protein n=1 Tax=Alkalihalobacterium chitinilyticum TaxID=2980103 RepID=A0ABT5VEE3_9BACI|nr:hypothetical protein [Alkalihalobacterium chitinilyticum]MDE5413506.1 hypothetical protein [Alkalihalobacterium chitinilyticum]
MRRILPGSILTYSQYGHVKIPKEVKCKCPDCSKTARFTLKADYQANRTGLFSKGNCPECKSSSSFVIMLSDYLDKSNEDAEVYIYDPKTTFAEVENHTNIPEDLIRAYRSALNVHQSKDPSATAVLSKRVLESVVKSFLGDKVKGQSLSEQLEHLPKHLDLNKPITSLTSLTHPESHFHQILELERDLDEDMARLLIELLEGIIEYLYILPSKIETTHDRIQQQLH